MPADRGSMDAARATRLQAAELTYPEVCGTSEDPMPTGYRTFRRVARVSGATDFAAARRDLLDWAVQRRAGLRVTASGPVEPDAVVDLGLGVGPLRVTAPCRVVHVVDEPDRCGFAYGTLPGHPESGEEAFVLERDAAGVLTFTVRAFSRPASALSRLAGPLGPRVQDLITARYLRAFT